MDNHISETQKELRQRVIALLTREQIDFLDKLGKDSLFSCGRKLTHTKIISHIIDILLRLGIDGKGVKTSNDLEEKIKNILFKNLFTQSISTPKEGPKIKDTALKPTKEKGDG